MDGMGLFIAVTPAGKEERTGYGDNAAFFLTGRADRIRSASTILRLKPQGRAATRPHNPYSVEFSEG